MFGLSFSYEPSTYIIVVYPEKPRMPYRQFNLITRKPASRDFTKPPLKSGSGKKTLRYTTMILPCTSGCIASAYTNVPVSSNFTEKP